MRRWLTLFIFGVLFITTGKCYGQGQESVCGQREVLFPKIHLLNIPSPADKTDQDDVMTDYQYTIATELTRNNPSLIINRVTLTREQVKSFYSNSYKYILLATFVSQDAGIQLRLTLQSSCSEKVLAKTDVFLPNALIAENAEQLTQAARQAAATLSSLINISDFESKERAAHNYGLGGQNWGGRIGITVDQMLAKGEETQVEMKVIDCDGELLRNKQISTKRTVGGIFTPATFTTNANGIATAKFRMTTDKRAVIVAMCETENVQGCQDLYTGDAIVKGLKGQMGYKVTVDYKKITRLNAKLKSADPMFTITMANESEYSSVRFSTSFYHFAPPPNPKEADYYLQIKPQESSDSQTVFVSNTGSSINYKITRSPEVKINPLNSNLRTASDSTEESISFTPMLPEVSMNFTNGVLKAFDITVDFPEKDKALASGGFLSISGDKTSSFVTHKITNPKSLYKTEYIIKYNNKISESGPQGLTDIIEEAVVHVLLQ